MREKEMHDEDDDDAATASHHRHNSITRYTDTKDTDRQTGTSTRQIDTLIPCVNFHASPHQLRSHTWTRTHWHQSV